MVAREAPSLRSAASTFVRSCDVSRGMLFGSFVRCRLRKARGLAQEKLAFAAGLSREAIRRLENSRGDTIGRGGLQIETIEGIAAALQVDPAELLMWDPEATRV